MRNAVPRSFSRIYRWPLLLAFTVALGLAAALSGESVARVFSWFALAVPLAVIVVCVVSGELKRSGPGGYWETNKKGDSRPARF